MRLLIPPARPNPGPFARLGRVLYWTALTIAALLLFIAADAFWSPIPTPSPDGLYVAHGMPWDTYAFAAGLVVLIGRAIRYVMASE